MSTSALAEWLARRERAVVLGGLSIVIAFAWAWLLAGRGMGLGGGRPGASEMPGMVGAGEGPLGTVLWSGAPLVVFSMWSVMMVAMMMPGAAPAVLLFAAISRSRMVTMAWPSTGAFAAAYLLVWAAFSAVATMAHLVFRQVALLSPGLRTTSGVFTALLLIVAGVYQLTPLKSACLRHCRTPVQFFTRNWRYGTVGALRLGVLHGGYCIGCCWALMGLLFVGGVMNLWWVATLALFVAVEKTAFLGAMSGRIVSGAGLVVAGTVALVVR